MAACVASDGEVYLFGGLDTVFNPDPTIAAPLADPDIQGKATAVKAQMGKRSSALFRLEELGRPPTAPAMSRRLRAMLKAEVRALSLTHTSPSNLPTHQPCTLMIFCAPVNEGFRK